MLSPELYDMMPYIFAGFFAIYGILMIACPKVMIKKEFRDDQEKLAKTRKSGIGVIFCAFVLLIVACM